MSRVFKKDEKRIYKKPVIKSSEVKTISFYGKGIMRGPADAEMLLAAQDGS